MERREGSPERCSRGYWLLEYLGSHKCARETAEGQLGSYPSSPRWVLAIYSIVFESFRLYLDISYTRAPEWVKLIPNYIHSRTASFWQLARLAFPEELRKDDLPEALPSPQHQVQLPPDEHLVCYDYLYYVVAQSVGCCLRSSTPRYAKYRLISG